VALLYPRALGSLSVASYDSHGYGGSILTPLLMGLSRIKVEVEVTLRPTVSLPVSLGVRRPSGTRDQFYFLLEIFFRQLRICNFVAPSLTRGRVCNIVYNCFWVLPEQSSLLGRSSAELTAIFYCLIWESPNLEGQVPVFISPRNRSWSWSWSSSCGRLSVDRSSWYRASLWGPWADFIFLFFRTIFFTTDSQSASLSWCQAPIWDLWPIFLSPRNFL
jgi:hypothetical protein